MKDGALIRFLVVALPSGLLLFGVGAMMVTHFKPSEENVDPNEKVRLEAASLNRSPIARADLERNLNTLAVQIGERHVGKPDALEQAAIWIESTIGSSNLGYVIEHQIYSVNGVEVRNLVAELPGTTRRDEIVVVGAHYDSVPDCPGANDNGTGVVALLSLAKAFAGDPQERTIRFVAFVNEEPPYFHTEEMGSLVYARRCKARRENIVSMLALETMGYFSEEAGSQKVPEGLEGAFPDQGDFLVFVGNQESRFLADSAKTAFRLGSGLPAIGGGFPESVPGVAWSDHWSFWQAGYPGVMVTDTAPYRYPHYHKPTDTPDKIDFEKLTKAVEGIESVIRVWANP